MSELADCDSGLLGLPVLACALCGFAPIFVTRLFALVYPPPILVAVS
jgi:hypothetical protein